MKIEMWIIFKYKIICIFARNKFYTIHIGYIILKFITIYTILFRICFVNEL